MPDIFWIGGNPPHHPMDKSLSTETPGLAIVTRPRGTDWLADEVLALKRAGIDTLVSLLEPHEAAWLGLEDERAEAEKAGLDFLNLPIPDTEIPPNFYRFRSFVSDLACRLRNGQRIGVHCRGSIGRATVTAACTLVHLGWKPRHALAAVEMTRGCPVPDTEEQQRWILAYEVRP
jgi:protein-tyrosine phosphatase